MNERQPFGPPTFLLGWTPAFRGLDPAVSAGVLRAADRFVRAAPRGTQEEWDLRGRLVRGFMDATVGLARETGADRNTLAAAVGRALEALALRPLDLATPQGLRLTLQALAHQVREELRKEEPKLEVSAEALLARALEEIERQFAFEAWAEEARPAVPRLSPLPPLRGPSFRLPPLPSLLPPLPRLLGGDRGTRRTLPNDLSRPRLP